MLSNGNDVISVIKTVLCTQFPCRVIQQLVRYILFCFVILINAVVMVILKLTIRSNYFQTCNYNKNFVFRFFYYNCCCCLLPFNMSRFAECSNEDIDNLLKAKDVWDNTFIPFRRMGYHIYPTRSHNIHLGFASVDISHLVG